jgi:signal transduction histidine kinase
MICIFGFSVFPAIAVEAETQNTIRVGWFLVPGLQEISADGQPSGYNYEYLQAISQYTDWKYEFVEDTWEGCLSSLEEGKIDLLGCVSYSADRAEKIDFSEISAGNGGISLASREDDLHFSYGDYEAFNGMKVGSLLKGNRTTEFQKICRKHGITADIREVGDQTDLLSGLQDGTFDLVLLSKARRATGYKTVLSFAQQPFYFAFSKGNEEKLEALDNAMGQMISLDASYNISLTEKYFSSVTSKDDISFTKKEKEYIESHPEIVVAYDPAWPPIEYRDKDTGEMRGLMKDIFGRISESTGLQFRFVASDDFETTKRDYRGKAQVFSSLTMDYGWGDNLGYRLSIPLYTMQILKVSSSDNGKVIALPEGYYLTKAVQERYKDADYEYRYYKTVEECINAVQRRLADGTFVNSYEFSYYLSIPRFSRLHFQSIPGFLQKISIAVSKQEDKALYSVINKAAGSISEDDLEKIQSDSHYIKPISSLLDLIYAYPFYFLLILIAFLFLIFTAALMLFRSHENKKKAMELADLNARLKRASEAKSEFLSRMSHDIRTPMNGIIGMTRIAEEQDNPRKTQDCLNKISISSGYMLGLLNNILDLTKIESGKLVLHPEPYTKKELISYLNSVIRPIYESKKQIFKFEDNSSANCVPVIDKLRFNQILFNILSNAGKYTPEGGHIALTIFTETDGKNMDLTASVSDDGIGISEKFQEELFDVFTQEERLHETGNEGGSSGLGLAIVKKLVDSLGGTIQVKSREGEGSVFTVHFSVPCVSEDQVSAGRDKKEQVNDFQKLSGKNVLVCEDNMINQEIEKAILENYGMHVDLAANGMDGVRKFEESAVYYYDFIVTDIRMPVMNGLEEAGEIRKMSRPDAAKIAIIALTANAFDEDIKKCLDAGMDAYVVKPVSPAALIETMLACADACKK